MRNAGAIAILTLAVSIGGGSLLLFAYFLAGGSPLGPTLPLSHSGRLAFDACLCLFFFFQHSGMIRQSVKTRLGALVPGPFYPASYAIASGVALVLVVILWQPGGHVLFRLEGPIAWGPAVVSLMAMVGFFWGVRSLGGFDLFGDGSIRRWLRGKPDRPPRFTAEGPYRYVRHPFYTCVLVLFWSTPRLTCDRLLFDVLWTAWVVAATYYEERDLVAAFGESYRSYQRSVPRLLPWRPPRQPVRA